LGIGVGSDIFGLKLAQAGEMVFADLAKKVVYTYYTFFTNL